MDIHSEDILFHHPTNLHLSLTSNCPENQLCYVETSHGLCTASVPASRWPRPQTNNGPVPTAAVLLQPPSDFLISELRQLRHFVMLLCNIMVQSHSSVKYYNNNLSVGPTLKTIFGFLILLILHLNVLLFEH